jgi:hypothetical protein
MAGICGGGSSCGGVASAAEWVGESAICSFVYGIRPDSFDANGNVSDSESRCGTANAASGKIFSHRELSAAFGRNQKVIEFNL